MKRQRRKIQNQNIFEILESDEDFFDTAIAVITQGNDKQDKIMFSPDSGGKVLWEVIGLIFIIYQSVLIPYRLCFAVES